MEDPIVAPTREGHYFLRGLVRCRPCGKTLIPAYSSGGRRYYGCPNATCPRPWVPAELPEELVWARFAARDREAARTVPAHRRQEALAAALVRVTVGVRPDDLEYEWRN